METTPRIPQPDPDRPMTPFGRAVFEAFAQASEAVSTSDRVERIAQDLCAEEFKTFGVRPPVWQELPAMLKDRHRDHARRAIALLNPELRLQAIDRAVEATLKDAVYANEHGHEMSPAEIAREACARLEVIYQHLMPIGGVA
jgi:hypothetical protein